MMNIYTYKQNEWKNTSMEREEKKNKKLSVSVSKKWNIREGIMKSKSQ